MYFLLEAEGFECVLADARQARNLPGRPKRDTSGSQWLAQNFERGAVRSCFVATPEFRVIRLHTRYRRDLIQERSRERQRAEKLLESAGIKLSGVLADLHGVSGRDITDHLIAGERDPRALAQLARRRARAKIPRLEQALDGTEFFTARHAALLEAMLRRIDAQSADIDQVSAVTGELLAPWEEQLQQAESMPGWQRRTAQDVLAETGLDMTRFATPAHLVSRAGRAPLDRQSGQRKGRGRKGNRYIGAAAGEASVSAGRTRTREGARCRRLSRRIGKDKAQAAVSNTQLRVYHELLSAPGARYQDLGADYYDKYAQARRKTRYHLAELDALGYDVIITPRPGPDPGDAAEGEQTPAA